jgi:hypothetical protein
MQPYHAIDDGRWAEKLIGLRIRTTYAFRSLLDAKAPPAPQNESRSAACFRIFGVDPEMCPKCEKGRLVVRATWRATRLPIDAVLATLAPRAP